MLTESDAWHSISARALIENTKAELLSARRWVRRQRKTIAAKRQMLDFMMRDDDETADQYAERRHEADAEIAKLEENLATRPASLQVSI